MSSHDNIFKQLQTLSDKDRQGQDACSICLMPMPSVRTNRHSCYECLLNYTNGPTDGLGHLLDPVTRIPLKMCHKGHPRTGICGYMCDPTATADIKKIF